MDEKKDIDVFKKPEPEPEKLTITSFMSEMEARLEKIHKAIKDKKFVDVNIDLRHIVYMFNMSDIAAELYEDLLALHRPKIKDSFRVPPPCTEPCVYCKNIARWENVITVLENTPPKKPV